jgi:hypothetical protein
MDKFLPIGSISHGTMRNEDLVPAFLDTLETVDKKHARSIKREYSKALRKLAGVNVRDYSEEQYSEDLTYLVNEDLFNALSNHTPDYFYFGSHEGDGSDYGVWISQESIRDDIHDGILFEISDLSQLDSLLHESSILPKNVILTNDHGNMSLYSILLKVEDTGNDWKLIMECNEVWSVV